MEKTKTAEQVQQALAAQAEEAANQEKEAAKEDPVTALRRSMANNFLQHCINSEAANGNPHALEAGCVMAIADLCAAVLNLEAGTEADRVPYLANGVGSLVMNNNEVVAETIMRVWAVGLAMRGRLQTVIGTMLDTAEGHRMNFLMEQIKAAGGQPEISAAPEQAPEPALQAEPEPDPVAPEEEESSPLVDVDDGEVPDVQLPAEDAE